MFTYTVYGVTGIPSKSGPRRVQPVNPVTATHPVTPSWITQRPYDDKAAVHSAFTVPGVEKQPKEETASYQDMYRMARHTEAEPKQSTSIRYLENAQSLVLSYRKSKGTEGSPDFNRRREALEQMTNNRTEDPNDLLAWII